MGIDLKPSGPRAHTHSFCYPEHSLTSVKQRGRKINYCQEDLCLRWNHLIELQFIWQGLGWPTFYRVPHWMISVLLFSHFIDEETVIATALCFSFLSRVQHIWLFISHGKHPGLWNWTWSMGPLGFPFKVVFRNSLFLAFVLIYTFKSLFSSYFHCFQRVVLVSPFYRRWN